MKPNHEDGRIPDLAPDLAAALKALADADRGREAPQALEARLAVAFRQKHRRAFSERAWPVLMTIAAMAVIGVGGIAIGYYKSWRVDHTTQVAAKTPVVSIEGSSSTKLVVPLTQVASSLDPSGPRPSVRRAQPAQPREIATEFFPLVDYSVPADDTEVLRVSLPASAMREVGLPVREDRLMDRVQADVVLSNGLATAIRFVKYAE